jgi:exopolysaccharide biosynthesis polyprenyl glycosylphosphotransferase
MRPTTVKKEVMIQGASRSNRESLFGTDPEEALVSELEFRRAIRREKGRTERSQSPFILMLLDAGALFLECPTTLPSVLGAVGRSTRDTDLVGWYATGSVLGVIFTEVNRSGVSQQAEVLLERTRQALGTAIRNDSAERIAISVYLCPEEGETTPGAGPAKPASPIDEEVESPRKMAALFVKRVMDIVGSLLALVVFSPVLLATAIAVKLSSKGPVFFLQPRVGLGGQTFVFIKFRSMKTDNDPAIHKAYVEQFINKGAAARKDGEGTAKKALYKIPNDPRVTKVGAFLRRTSLDEFPQFYNVLKGEMSLVGPRPPIPYEVNRYDAWHKRRYLSVKPGLTGLWQVHGRSRTTFDEMVRLDLLYARTWTIWGDIKILLQTPFAVINGDGAM